MSGKYPQHMGLWHGEINNHYTFKPTQGFPHFTAYMLGANLGLLLNGNVSMMVEKMCHLSKQNTIFHLEQTSYCRRKMK